MPNGHSKILRFASEEGGDSSPSSLSANFIPEFTP